MLPALPHLIVLDEPTNHLDLDSLDALKAGLSNFRGALLCISHHREFVASIATELWFLRPEHAGAKTASCSRDQRYHRISCRYPSTLARGHAQSSDHAPVAPSPPLYAAFRRASTCGTQTGTRRPRLSCRASGEWQSRIRPLQGRRAMQHGRPFRPLQSRRRLRRRRRRRRLCRQRHHRHRSRQRKCL